MAKLVCLSDFERLARKILPKYAYDSFTSGANDEFMHQSIETPTPPNPGQIGG